ncbi:MAG TPA: hypothetical protein VN043_08515 [Rhodanobacter sp.]|nr:hypothetical protein [Rhodanobacter sp.]
MKFKFSLVLMAAGMILLPLAGYASKTEVVVKAQNKDDFSAVVAAVHQQMAPGGHWEFVDATERADIDAKFKDMQSLFDKYGTVDMMDNDSKARLYLDQEGINAILTHRDSRRLICKSERPIGSIIPKRTCRTYGAIEKDRDNAQQFMQQQARPGLTPGGH